MAFKRKGASRLNGHHHVTLVSNLEATPKIGFIWSPYKQKLAGEAGRNHDR